ncbi:MULTISPECIES: DUF4129 domain-containing protein [unclassified Isoptericola]|uniref:DUF4129 domain-containing protein n=1 Tax=unclassified Isoptericola TaxID=2623355 RepID=UPI003651A4DB
MAAPPTRPPRRATRAALAPLAVAILAALVVLGAATATPWRARVPDVVLPAPTASDPVRDLRPGDLVPADRPEPSYDLITWIVVALSVAGAILLVALVVMLARRVLRALADPEDDDEPDPLAPGAATAGTPTELSLPQLQDAVDAALARVDSAATPHDAVVAAWVALEDVAAEHGTTRDPAQTATEFTARLLTVQRHDGRTVPASDVDTLRRLYQRARFTDRPVDDAAVHDARTALSRIARALGPARTVHPGPAAHPTPTDPGA